MADALRMKGASPTGPGWLTVDEFGLKAKLGKVRSWNYLAAQVKAGNMEKFSGSEVRRAGEQARQQVWYRPIAR